ncbi:hypothetical protein GIB67_028714 [Kingdonia uniflora]|uniref:RING-type E3 ubiquitin transferase n=1 Tax=Kingdonia uniflora TaxID=39325 RepID=A0A7J7NAG3_9MAGN|nr:hypothetical protein GIB67_028714 [Kingdonia uniflora]
MMKKMKRNIVFFNTVTSSLIFLSCTLRLSSATIYLRGKSFSLLFPDAPARFAVRVNASGVCGALHVGEPIDGCSPLRNGYRRISRGGEGVRFVLVERGKCAFEDKVRNAQESGFDVVVVFDDHDKRSLVSMIGNPEGIWAHAIFVSKTAGETLKKLAHGEEDECCINLSLEETAWTVLVISLISLFAIISILATFFFTRNRRLHQQGSHHSPTIDSQIVKLLPCLTFSSALPSSHRTGETCAICLEDYRIGETLRVLPCRHGKIIINP